MAPPILGAAAIGTSLIGGLTSAIGGAQSSSAQSQMYQYQAGLSLQNQQIAKQNANYALMQGEQQAAQSGMKSRFQEGQIKVGEAASGFDVNVGSNRQVQQSQKMIGQNEQTAIRSSAAKTAYDYDVSAQTAGIQADMYKAASKNVQAAEPIGIASTILGSVGSVATKWQNMATQGVNLSSISAPSFGF